MESGQTMAAAARGLGAVEQSLGNWIKLHRAGRLQGASDRREVTAEQMEISRLRAELARVTMERATSCHPTDINPSAGTPAWEKPRRSSQRASDQVRLYRTAQASLAHPGAVPGARRERLRF